MTWKGGSRFDPVTGKPYPKPTYRDEECRCCGRVGDGDYCQDCEASDREADR
jgi:hypothetical protein